MSEMKIEAAYGIYRKHRSSDSIEALCESIVRGQAEYGNTITHIYSFVDINDIVQLFYCKNGNHEDLLTSPHVRKRALLWQSGRAHAAPEYLKRAYADLLRCETATKARIDARTVQYVPGNTGPAIRERLEALGADLGQPHTVTFKLRVKFAEEKAVSSTLEQRGFSGGMSHGGSDGYYGSFKKDLALDDQAISAVADSVADIAKAAGGELQYCWIDPVTGPVKSQTSRARKVWWKFW